MKLKLLPSTFESDGSPSKGQHFTCFVIDDLVAVDAGSLGGSVNESQKSQIRDVLLTHAHLDHIAGLPIFIDDHFATLQEPVIIHARREVIDVLEKHIFNWEIYPRFSELKNTFGNVLVYREIAPHDSFEIKHLKVRSVDVNHKVISSGFVISDDSVTIGMTGDTSEMDDFWNLVNNDIKLTALMIECAFPDELNDLADISHHMTPRRLLKELEKFEDSSCPIFVTNLKPMYRQTIVDQINTFGDERIQILEVGREYHF